MQNMTGFYKDNTKKTVYNTLKDNQGIDLTMQLLSQRPKKMFENHIGDHTD